MVLRSIHPLTEFQEFHLATDDRQIAYFAGGINKSNSIVFSLIS